MPSATYRPPRPLDLRLGLGVLRRGGGDPTHRVVDGEIWRTARTPAGPGTLRVRAAGVDAVLADTIRADAWGPGADWLLAGLPELLGSRDDPAPFHPGHPLLARLHRLHAGLFLPRTALVLEMLVPAVLEQKVTGIEARRAWRALVTRFGTPAPGPAPPGMAVVPDAAGWLSVPTWEWHRAGVDGKRARTIRAAAAMAAGLERTLGLGCGEQVRRMLRTVPGVGEWTAAEVAQRAHGDPDAVSVGDLHLPALVGVALTGERVDDAGMLELLAPYRPQRYRAVRLLELAGIRVPRFAPRFAPRDYRLI